MSPELETALHLVAALAIGLLIGLERGWSGRKEDEGDRVAGIRTLTLISLFGGISVEISELTGAWIIGVMFGAVTLITLTAYVQEVKETKDIGTTTSFTMLITFILGAWAAFGSYVYAFSVTAVVVTLLGIKPTLHKWVSKIETVELYAGLKLLIISLVMLPLLPNEGIGPWEAINLYWIWWMVVLISGISFLGYLSIKYIGDEKGVLITSITGGLASSMAVTLNLAQFARNYDSLKLLTAGVLFALSVMFIRVLTEVAIVNPALLGSLWLPVGVMFTGVVLSGIWFWNQSSKKSDVPDMNVKNPFKLSMALKFGLLLATIMFLAAAMEEWFGNRGIYLLSVISGMANVDAITVSLSNMARRGMDSEVATMGIVIATAVSILVKGLIFSFFAGLRNNLLLIGLLTLTMAAGLLTAAILVY